MLASARTENLNGQLGVDPGGFDDIGQPDLIVNGMEVAFLARAKAHCGDTGHSHCIHPVSGEIPFA